MFGSYERTRAQPEKLQAIKCWNLLVESAHAVPSPLFLVDWEAVLAQNVQLRNQQKRHHGIFWLLDMNGPTFDMSISKPFGSRLAAALRMAQYMRDVVFPDGERLRELLSPQPIPATAKLLPMLPTLLPEQREPGPLRPFAKRRSG
ncbi:hypothetical protein HDU87_005501 [Geranomyces variabilis]|uniref:Uncharacterized protein n=1 Tax=Geranomyces variabilis TaxID=109894 RepID=A0AAD5XL37_9FUNG|nr:hypothetical protein HDU87_005501 [Geranomyces variabilis]